MYSAARLTDKSMSTGANLIQINRPKPDYLTVFVHGLSGSSERSYWGRIPDFLEHDPLCKNIDFVFWGYVSSKWPKFKFSQIFHKRSKTRRAEDAILVLSNLLLSDIREMNRRQKYKKIRIFGHSLGGIIAIRSVALSNSGVLISQIDKLAVNATPTTAIRVARFAAFFNLRTNDYVTFLSRPDLVHRVFDNDLIHIKTSRSQKIHTTYFHVKEDQYVPFNEQASFDDEIVVNGKHTWMSEISSQDDLDFQKLRSWILN